MIQEKGHLHKSATTTNAFCLRRTLRSFEKRPISASSRSRHVLGLYFDDLQPHRARTV